MQRLSSQKPTFFKFYTEYLSEDSDYEYNSEEDDWNYEVKLEQPSPTKSLHWDTETTPSCQNSEKTENNISHQSADEDAMEDDNVTDDGNQQITSDERELLQTFAYMKLN